jgi:hypothetical protein
MSDEVTARWALPLLQSGQAQKEMFHNEALAALDLLAQGAVLSAGANSPPADPAEGECWLVGDSPDGAWAGHSGKLAGWTAGGWRFVAPRDGMTAWVAAEGVYARYAEGVWRIGELPVATLTVAGHQVVGARQGAIPDPAGGSVIDAESRAALAAILAAMRAHGLIEN